MLEAFGKKEMKKKKNETGWLHGVCADEGPLRRPKSGEDEFIKCHVVVLGVKGTCFSTCA